MNEHGKLEIYNSTFRWEIENFSSIEDSAVGVKVLSPVFETQHHRSKKLPWRIVLFPGGCDEGSKDYVGLCLSYFGERSVTVGCSFSTLDEKRNKVFEYTIPEELHEKNGIKGTRRYGSKTAIRNEINKESGKDTLVIFCTMTVRSVGLNDEMQYDADDSARAHFERLLESGDLSDVTFKIGEKQMRLHKAIVSSVSPVFLAMFQHEMREKEESVVQIPDVEYEVMKELFRYIYVRKVNGIESITGDLFVAADKYDVQGLKILCEDVLYHDINADNALQYFELAFKCNTTFLKSKATEFVVNSLGEFVDRPEFKRMDGSCKDELLRAIARNKVKNDT